MKQQGFTLIELVIVIVILGILSAFALPRFADLSGDAHEASVEGARGAVSSASSIVRAAVLAGGDEDEDSIIVEGETITLVDGYAAPTENGIGEAAQLSGDDYDLTEDEDTDELTVASEDCSFDYGMAEGDDAPTIGEVSCGDA